MLFPRPLFFEMRGSPTIVSAGSLPISKAHFRKHVLLAAAFLTFVKVSVPLGHSNNDSETQICLTGKPSFI